MPNATTTDQLRSALDSLEEIQGKAEQKHLAVFLDYDGTLTPIVERPELATLSGEARRTVRDLAALCPLAVISGRDLRDVQNLVGIDGIFYAGSHGFDIEGPAGQRFTVQQGAEFLPLLDELEGKLRERLDGIAGAQVERKKFSIAVHYRRVEEPRTAQVEGIVDEELARQPRFRKTHGKKVYDLQPEIDWHKGKALGHLLGALDLNKADVLPLYVGDDLTDEDAFRAIAGSGLGIVVRDEVRPTAAQYALEDTGEVMRFLQLVAGFLRQRRAG